MLAQAGRRPSSAGRLSDTGTVGSMRGLGGAGADAGEEKEEAIPPHPFYPSAFVSHFIAVHGQPVVLNTGDLDPVLSERLQQPRAMVYLAQCFKRANFALGDAAPEHKATLQTVSATVVSYAVLMLQNGSLFPDEHGSGARQLISWLSQEGLSTSSDSSPFLAAIVASAPHAVPAISVALFAEVIADVKATNLIKTFLGPLLGLKRLLSVQTFAEEFVFQEEFIHPMFNGHKIETASPFGFFFRLVALPEEPSVGERYFANPLTMTDMEKTYCMKRLESKLEQMHSALTDIVDVLLDKPLTRSGVTTWVACALLSNWSRTRMRAQRRAISSDGFLLNLTCTLLRVARRRGWFGLDRLSRIDPVFCLVPSRLELRQETKVRATGEEVANWRAEYLERLRKGQDRQNASSGASAASPVASPVIRANIPGLNSVGLLDDDNLLTVASGGVDEPSRAAASLLSDEATVPAARPSLGRMFSADSEPSEEASGSTAPASPVAQAAAAPIALPFFAETGSLPLEQLAPRAIIDPVLPGQHDGAVSSSDADHEYLRRSTSHVHSGIVCDKCRARRMEGVRYKCANCQDYDLCAVCENSDYIDSLGLARHAGVTFSCPYAPCGASDLTEVALRDHVRVHHADARNIVQCPVCLANGNQNLFIQPRFDEHLAQRHCDEHNPVTHTMIKLPRLVPHYHDKEFTAQAPLELELDPAEHKEAQRRSSQGGAGDGAEEQPAVVASPGDWRSAETAQARVVHESVRCSHCGKSPIKGIRYCCYNCEDFNLCSYCEGLGVRVHGHDASHVFLKMRRALKPNEHGHRASRLSPMPLLYPSAMLGSRGFNEETEWLFLIVHSLHVGMLKTCGRYNSLVQGVEHERDRAKLESLTKIKLCVEAQLLQQQLLRDALDTYIFLARWMLLLIDPEQKGLPFPEKPTMEFAGLPEYFVQDASEYVLFLARFSVETLDQADMTPLIHLFTCLISSVGYLGNPYLRAKLVEVICGVCEYPTAHGLGCPSVTPVLMSDPLVVENLCPALVRLYVDIEHTGSDSQFYDKFNVRHAIAVLLNYLGRHDAHKAVLAKAASDLGVFLRFANNIVNDLIYLLDETLAKACAMHALQQQTASLANSRRHEHERNLTATGRQLRTASVLSAYTLTLLHRLSQLPAIAELLMRPEMVERISHTINDYVHQLASANKKKFLLVDGSQWKFTPDEWLNTFMGLYLCFEHHDVFTESVAKEGSCFDEDVVNKALQVLRDKQLKNEVDLDKLQQFFARTALRASQLASEQEELGEVPEAFLDPILSTLMVDPVRLPSSGVAMDRAVITRILLNDNTDPFNRAPLKVEELVPDDDLKERIQRWRMSGNRILD